MKDAVWSQPELQLWGQVQKQASHLAINQTMRNTYDLVDLFSNEVRDTLVNALIEE